MRERYEKPVISIANSIAEDIYMASGGCFTATCSIVQRPETGRDDYRIQLNAQHDATHTCAEQKITLTFNNPVTFVSCGAASYESGNGTNTIVLKRYNFANGKDSIGIGDIVVKSDFDLDIVSVSVTDNSTY
jgi:hypothetical protein